MPRFELITDPDSDHGADGVNCQELTAAEAEALLHRAGVQFGRALPPPRDHSTEPRLRHARALLQLQQRFGPMDHVRRHRATSASPAPLIAAPDDGADEWLLVVEGRLGGLLPLAGGWLRCHWEPLDWFTRPRGLRALPSASGKPEPVEWLVLSRARWPGRPSLDGSRRAIPLPAVLQPELAARASRLARAQGVTA